MSPRGDGPGVKAAREDAAVIWRPGTQAATRNMITLEVGRWNESGLAMAMWISCSADRRSGFVQAAIVHAKLWEMPQQSLVRAFFTTLATSGSRNGGEVS